MIFEKLHNSTEKGSIPRLVPIVECNVRECERMTLVVAVVNLQ